MLAIAVGATTHPDRTKLLAFLSVAGLVTAALLGRVVLSRVGQRAWFWGYLLVLLSGPTLAYARSTQGEMLATGMLVCLVAATVLPAPPPVVALAALGACWTKETSYPFVVALGLLGLVLARRRTGLPVRSHVLWGAAGTAGGVVTASLFNVVRFGSVLNTNYLEPDLHTPGLVRKAEYAFAVLVSPSGGFVVFWPAAGALLIAACVLPFVRSRRKLDPWPALVLVAVLLGLTIGFASWWTPLGWSGYGPRLITPWLPPLVLLGLVAYGEPLGRLAGRLLTPSWRLIAVAAIVLAFALPHVGYAWKTDSIGGFFGQETPPCDAPWRGGVEAFHACQSRELWLDRPMGLYALRGVRTAGGAVTSLAVGVGVLSCLLLLREGLATEARHGRAA
jgi:hypothetical protein